VHHEGRCEAQTAKVWVREVMLLLTQVEQQVIGTNAGVEADAVDLRAARDELMRTDRGAVDLIAQERGEDDTLG